jgi:hypothetical protein
MTQYPSVSIPAARSSERLTQSGELKGIRFRNSQKKRPHGRSPDGLRPSTSTKWIGYIL